VDDATTVVANGSNSIQWHAPRAPKRSSIAAIANVSAAPTTVDGPSAVTDELAPSTVSSLAISSAEEAMAERLSQLHSYQRGDDELMPSRLIHRKVLKH
jgi:hypothetical protein